MTDKHVSFLVCFVFYNIYISPDLFYMALSSCAVHVFSKKSENNIQTIISTFNELLPE